MWGGELRCCLSRGPVLPTSSHCQNIFPKPTLIRLGPSLLKARQLCYDEALDESHESEPPPRETGIFRRRNW